MITLVGVIILSALLGLGLGWAITTLFGGPNIYDEA